MTQQFTDDVEIQGDLDVDGNLRVGDDPGTTNAMIEAQRDAVSTTKPKRGLQTTGEVEDENAPSSTLTWSNHEVSVSGTSTDVTQVTALRASAQSSDGDVDSLVGIEANVDPVSGTVNEAVGLHVTDVTGASSNFSIKTGAGQVRLGDLAGSGDKLVKVDNDGDLTQASPGSDYLEPDSGTGNLKASDFPQLTGAVTTPGNSLTTTLANNTVTSSKLVNSAVTNAKLGSSAVTSAKLASNAVTTAKLKTATGSITSDLGFAGFMRTFRRSFEQIV